MHVNPQSTKNQSVDGGNFVTVYSIYSQLHPALKDVSRARLQQIGDICASKASLCENHPFEVTAVDIVDALLAADALGQARLEHLQ